MERFVQEQNLRRFRELLPRVTDEAQRKQILYLIAREKIKSLPPKLESTAE